MIKCEVCQKECKTGQGLAGHMRFAHGILPDKQYPLSPPKRFITDEQLTQALAKISSNIYKCLEEVTTSHARLMSALVWNNAALDEKEKLAYENSLQEIQNRAARYKSLSNKAASSY